MTLWLFRWLDWLDRQYEHHRWIGLPFDWLDKHLPRRQPK